jgi:rod shape-determining protein MreC
MLWRFFSRNRRTILVALSVLVSLAVMTVNWRGGKEQGSMDGAIMLLATPLLEGTEVFSSGLGTGGDFLLGWRQLEEENRRLREEVAKLSREVEKSREERMAFRRLANILDFRSATDLRMTVAAVISHDSTNLFRTVLINKGLRDGIVKDAAVVTPEGVVGKTTKVYGASSRVLLLTDRSSGIDALVRRTRDQGVLQGLGKGECEMKYLAPQADIAAGDSVVTSGMAGVFPKGLRIGSVTKVRRGGYLLRNVEVRPAAALDRLEEVIVLLPAGQRGEE